MDMAWIYHGFIMDISFWGAWGPDNFFFEILVASALRGTLFFRDFAHFCRIYWFIRKKKRKNAKIAKIGCGGAAGVEWPGMEWEAAPPQPIFAIFAFFRFFFFKAHILKLRIVPVATT